MVSDNPKQWEFANDDFIRGQQHRLKNIHSRKPMLSHSSHTQGSRPLADAERRDYGEEIERLNGRFGDERSRGIGGD
jgi:heat shock transcription factor, other eukaryote